MFKDVFFYCTPRSVTFVVQILYFTIVDSLSLAINRDLIHASINFNLLIPTRRLNSHYDGTNDRDEIPNVN